jgi:hypothetical protein
VDREARPGGKLLNWLGQGIKFTPQNNVVLKKEFPTSYILVCGIGDL